MGYFMFMLISCFWLSPFRDTFYYWDWSRHLSLSYYDGPPLIAYTIKLSTILFGNTLFALNVVGLASVVITGLFVYKIAELLVNKEAGWLASALYFTAPFVNQELLGRVTYDNLLNLFWLSSLYYVIRYVRFKKLSDFYLFACSAGLMMLSKYTGIILLMALFVYFVSSDSCRVIFKNKHFYIALLLILSLFSPVLMWNAQNNWVSFKYQFSIHQIGVVGYFNQVPDYQPAMDKLSEHLGNWLIYLLNIVENFNILLILALLGIYKSKQNSEGLHCLKWVSGFVVIFWLVVSAFANMAANYTMPLFGMISIMAACYLAQYKHVSWGKLIVALFILISIFMTVSHLEGMAFNSREADYILAKQANEIYLNDPQPVITPHYVAAEQIGFWLTGRPQVYALSCGLAANQYDFWQQDFMDKLKQHQIKQAWFFDYMDEPYCIQPYFKICVKLSTLAYQKQSLYVYHCTN
ncbi:MAG: dolichol monophosphate mannose synthase [Gammaproteobacteria bacterium]|jgi:4-amino-4-deoxy-L-arabinose transferase-like glycosyltransferase|nr:dolichol monophosphate mannose synthase [Gammaproteobacteria bacterium]